MKKKNKKKSIDRNTLYIFIGLVVLFFIFIIYYIFASNDNFSNVKIDKKSDLIYSVFTDEDYDVPCININDSNFVNINTNIINKVNNLRIKKGNGCTYTYSYSGEVVSIVIQYVELDDLNVPIVSFESYIINIKNKHILSNEEVYSKLDINEEYVSNVLENKFKYFYNDEKDKKIFDDECNYDCFLYMRGIKNSNYTDDIHLYIDKGKLYVLKVFNIYSSFDEERYFTVDDYMFEIT